MAQIGHGLFIYFSYVHGPFFGNKYAFFLLFLVILPILTISIKLNNFGTENKINFFFNFSFSYFNISSQNCNSKNYSYWRKKKSPFNTTLEPRQVPLGVRELPKKVLGHFWCIHFLGFWVERGGCVDQIKKIWVTFFQNIGRIRRTKSALKVPKV